MNVDQLKLKLKENSIDECMYSFDGGLPNEQYCIVCLDNVWEVYYSERGQKTNLMVFKSEDEACDYFWSLIV